MAAENLLNKDPSTFKDITEEERANLGVVMEELKGCDTADVERVISAMAEDAIYQDMTQTLRPTDTTRFANSATSELAELPTSRFMWISS